MQKQFSALAKEILKRDNFAIVSHYDADGLTSAAIIAKSLQREGKTAEIKIVKQLYPETLANLDLENKNVVFTDLGSGQISILKNSNLKWFCIIDHHQPEPINIPNHINAHLLGYSGNYEASASTLCFLLAKEIDPSNADLADIAIVGCLGDMQDSFGRLHGINRKVLHYGITAKVLQLKRDLRLYGRISRPLVQFLMYASNPFLPELTANETNCIKFLESAGIPLKNNGEWLSYEDLNEEQKKKLVTALVLHLAKKKFPEWKIKQLIGEVYTLCKEHKKSILRDGKEFATLCNACGRHNNAEIALHVCLGDRAKYYEKALNLLQKHRKMLREALQYLQQYPLQEGKYFYYFDAADNINDSIVGIAAGMLYSSMLLNPNKPIFGFAYAEDGYYKISARATAELVASGLNLAEILKIACKNLENSQAGGHSIAAGARIMQKDKEKFLQCLNTAFQNFVKS